MTLRVDRSLVKGSEPSISQSSFVLKLGRTVFLGPFENRLVVLPVSVHGLGLTGLFSCCFLRDVAAHAILGKAGRISVRVCNFSDRLVTLSPKMKVIRGTFSGVGNIHHDPTMVAHFSHDLPNPPKRQVESSGEDTLSFSAWQKLFPQLFSTDVSRFGDSSTLQALTVRHNELSWKSQVPFSNYGAPANMTDCSAEAAQTELQSLVARGIIRELDRYENGFFSPIMFLKKRDGRVRIVVDFRRLNKYSDTFNVFLPGIRSIVRSVNPSWRVFSTIDLRDGYFHIPVDHSLSRYFCFSCFGRRYRFTCLPQGWASSAGFFNDRVQRILGSAPVCAYFDDLIIGGRSRTEHDRNLHHVFTILQDAGMHINPAKVTFRRTTVPYLGYSISGDSYHQKAYISTQLSQLPPVTSRKDLQRILGIFTACRNSCPGLGLALVPLYTFLHKSVSQVDWATVQDLVRSVAALIFRNSLTFLRCVSSHAFHMEVDWAGNGAGYLLYAGERSHHRILATNSRAIRGFPVSSFLGELDAIVWCLQDTLAFTAGSIVHLYTDSLSALQKISSTDVWYKCRTDLRIGRRLGWLWENFPLNSRLFLHFLPSSDNYLADCLSRWPTLAQRKEVDVDEVRIEEAHLKRIKWAHEGHWSVSKTLLNLQHDGKGRWEGMRSDVAKFVEGCWTCQLWGSSQHRVDLGETKARNFGDAVGIDHAGPMPVEDDEDPRYVLVMVDYMSRWVEVWPCGGTGSAEARKCLESWVKKHGQIRTLISDNAGTWRSERIEDWCRRNGTRQRISASYMPKSNGMCERQIGILKGRLKRMSEAPQRWRSVLHRAVKVMNNSVNETTGYTAAELKDGMRRDGTRASQRTRRMWRRESLRRTAQRRAVTNSGQMKKYGRRPALRIGDHVLRARLKADAGTFIPPWDDEPCEVTEAVGSHMWIVEGLITRTSSRVHDDQLRRITKRTTAQLEACGRQIRAGQMTRP